MIRDHAHCVEQYIAGIQDGSIIAGKLVKLAVERHLDDLKNAGTRGYYFDPDSAVDACEFIEIACCHVKAEWGGQPFRLSPSQQFICWCVFGWKRQDDGFRRFRKAYVTCGRKWGKSLFASAILARMSVWDQPIEPGSEAYTVATTEDQAKIVYDAFETMVSLSEVLKPIGTIRTKRTTFADSPWFKSTVQPLGSDSKSKDGFSPHCVVIDELHEWNKHYRKLWEKMTTGGGSRRQPLMMVITTAGDENSVMWNEFDELCCKVLNQVESKGKRLGDSIFAFVARIDDDDDPFDESVWPKANPNMFTAFPAGIPDWAMGLGTPKIGYMREQAEEGELSAVGLNKLNRYHSNIKVSSTARAFTPDVWARGDGAVVDDWGKSYGAWDLGRTDDWAAVAVINKVSGEGDAAIWQGRIKCWAARDGSVDFRLQPFRSWAEQGLVEIIDGESINYDDVQDWIQWAHHEYGVEAWNYDATFSETIGQSLLNDHDIPVHPMYQNPKKYNEPVRKLMRLVKKGHFLHGGCPVFSWQALNLVVKQSGNDEWMPDKVNSDGKIDGVVAMLMALEMALFHESEIEAGVCTA